MLLVIVILYFLYKVILSHSKSITSDINIDQM